MHEKACIGWHQASGEYASPQMHAHICTRDFHNYTHCHWNHGPHNDVTKANPHKRHPSGLSTTASYIHESVRTFRPHIRIHSRVARVSEVDEFDGPVRAHGNVLELHVAVCNVQLVQVVQRLEELWTSDQ